MLAADSDLAAPRAARRRVGPWRHPSPWLGLALVIAAVGTVGFDRLASRDGSRPAPAIDACAVVPAATLEAIGISAVPAPFVPESPTDGSRGCSFGDGEPGVYATVFALSAGGRDVVARQQEVAAERDIATGELPVPGARAYVTGGPRERSESVVVVRGDRYVNVVVYNAVAGAATELVGPVAASLQ